MAQFDNCNSHKTKHTKTGLYNKVFLLSAIYILVRYIQCCANCSIHLHGICSRVDLMAKTLFYVVSNRGRGGFRCRVVAIWTWPSIYLSLRNCRWGVSRDPLFHLEPENAIDMLRGNALGDSDGQKGVLGRKGQAASWMYLWWYCDGSEGNISHIGPKMSPSSGWWLVFHEEEDMIFVACKKVYVVVFLWCASDSLAWSREWHISNIYVRIHFSGSQYCK